MRFDDGGWAEAVGNHVALDLVNTVARRLDPERRVDRLRDAEAVVRWARFVDLIGDAGAVEFAEQADDAELVSGVAAQVRALRERLYQVLQPMASGKEPAPGVVAELLSWLFDVLRSAEVAAVMPLRWSVPLRTVRDIPTELGLWAWHLLEHEDRRRLRQCRDPGCGWLFLDRTKNASRVWCSSADCGNRTRARRHYQRRTDASSSVPHSGGNGAAAPRRAR